MLLKYVGINPVVVHGGGPQIDEMLEQLGIESPLRARHAGHRRSDHGRRRDGARRQDQQGDRHACINRHGGHAVGLSGKDGELHPRAQDAGHASTRPAARRRPSTSAWSARSSRSTRSVIESLDRADFIPVIAPVGVGDERRDATTSTPTSSPARSPRRCAPRSSSCSPTSRASTTRTASCLPTLSSEQARRADRRRA